MKQLRLTACCLGAFVALAGLDLLFPEGQPVMARKAKADEAAKAPRAPVMPPLRDPSIAVAEEYEAARAKGTAEALELFIARHSDDPLAEKARAELKRLAR
ncbi:hypothetical protein [Bradyrhizobium cajani]|uniref:Uncharacterized protein n=1 Tax=Bradyrhizobium cajani TaxID=1928661 RepID=A0A844SXB7_9BRAD|nr:hypothetical protein [Bradyrhizobium cajani]MCP3367763.1 hypothetical protein [Bradyrhizobium cajani]MVT71598.1 hypothetical protein [Bradyrhizobium cajani]